MKRFFLRFEIAKLITCITKTQSLIIIIFNCYFSVCLFDQQLNL